MSLRSLPDTPSRTRMVRRIFMWAGTKQPQGGYGDHQHGRSRAPNFGQSRRQSFGGSFQARFVCSRAVASSARRRSPAPSLRRISSPGSATTSCGSLCKSAGNDATPNLSPIAQNQSHVQYQLQVQLGGQHPAWDSRAPIAQIRNPSGSAPIQFGPQANAPVWTDWGGNWMNVDAPPPYSAQPPQQ